MVIDQRAAVVSAARKTAGPTRRGLIAGAAAFGVLGAAHPGRASPLPSRLAAIDWAMLEAALDIGATPVAAAELKLFRSAAVEPAAPADIADFGLRGAPSYERLLAARPDLILISPWYEARAAALSRIAPVASVRIYGGVEPPYEAAIAATRALGARIGRERAAEDAVARAEAEISAASLKLGPLAGRSVLVINLGDARHFRVFGRDSMFGGLVERLGLRLAWTAPTRFGAYPTVGVEALAGMAEAIVVNVGPTPPAALAEVASSPLWAAMPPIAAGRFVDLPPVNPYGALPAARRFARLLAEGLGANV